MATSRVAIRDNRFGIKGARAAVSLNPTEPKPSEIVEHNNTVAK
jgi:hypothetical protein